MATLKDPSEVVRSDAVLPLSTDSLIQNDGAEFRTLREEAEQHG